MRIKGLVKMARQVRQQVSGPLTVDERSHLQEVVQQAIVTVEQLCQRGGIQPQQLPAPSRNAYIYLKQLDLTAVPIITTPPTITPAVKPLQTQTHSKVVRVRNICSEQHYLQACISRLSRHSNPQTLTAQPSYTQLREQIQTLLIRLETICTQEQVTPQSLSNTARPIYNWLRFLHQDANLQRHIQAVAQMHQIISQQLQSRSVSTLKSALRSVLQSRRNDTVAPAVDVEFTNMTALYRGQTQPHGLRLRLNEGFIVADAEVLKAIAAASLHGKEPATTTLIRTFALSEPFRAIRQHLDRPAVSDSTSLVSSSPTATQPSVSPPLSCGQTHDLLTIFQRINRDYFDGSLDPPQLAWSQRYTHRKFGHYEPASDRVVISRTLDQPQIPAYVVEFVMYHELLHKQQGIQIQNGRQRAHTTAFRQAEQQFQHYHQAEAYLSRLATLHRSS